jgi:hypothetical protein
MPDPSRSIRVNDLSAGRITEDEEERLLSEARRRLHELSEHVEFDHVPEASELVRFDAKMREIDRYLDLKTVEAGTEPAGDLRNWSYLVSAAASASAPSPCSRAAT